MKKVCLAQINTTPRDFAGNCGKIMAGIDHAVQEKCRLVVFPELTIPGYSVRDLMYTNGFVERNLDCLHEIVRYSLGKDVFIVIGYIDYNHTGIGKPFRNMAAVIHNGTIVVDYQKQLLPFYDVFDEGRYFEPGNKPAVFKMDDEKWGIIICEDGWNDKGVDDYNYFVNPLAQYRAMGVRNIVSINSSPYVIGKRKVRESMFRKASDGDGIHEAENGMLIIYVNQFGGQDELVFDGNSFIVENGSIRFNMPVKFNRSDLKTFNNGTSFGIFDLDGSFATSTVCIGDDYDELYNMDLLALHDYVRKNGFEKVVVGSSGGIDSAVVLALAAEALGPENVYGVRMPSKFNDQRAKQGIDDTGDALVLHKNLGINDFLVPIHQYEEYMAHVNQCFGLITGKYNKVADQNFQPRFRMIPLMHFSNAMGNVLVLATGNKTELATGYCTQFGDMAGGFDPIGGHYKMEVYEIGRRFNKQYQGRYFTTPFESERRGRTSDGIPQSIMDKAPSAGLDVNQTDEAELLPYPILDKIVQAYIEDYVCTLDEFCRWMNSKEKADRPNVSVTYVPPEAVKVKYDFIIRLIDRNEFKRRSGMATSLKVHKVDFGSGRRMPITKK